jgi:CpeT/CpcT family (DUF1001)
MNRNFRFHLSAALLSVSFTFGASGADTPSQESDLAKEVAQRLIGVLDSSDHSLEDPRYLDVTIQMCTITVESSIPGSSEGQYLYLEQAITEHQDEPYRQRVLQVKNVTGEAKVVSTAYKLAATESLVGFCKKPAAERTINFATLSDEGCPVFMTRDGTNFRGQTPEGGCPSVLRGAVSMTSKVLITADGMESWDQGWDANGKQVWGATAGPYRFRKVDISNQAPNLVSFGAFIVGRSDNQEQVQADPDFTPISYRICQVRPVGSSVAANNRLFYAEQGIHLPGRTITRQSVYQIAQSPDGSIQLTSHSLLTPQEHLGLCDRTENERLSIDAGIFKWDGTCTITYHWNESNEAFEGETPSEGCASTFQGASSLKITEVIKFGELSVWERWYDAAGKQVAGSTKGPYLYKRRGM